MEQSSDQISAKPPDGSEDLLSALPDGGEDRLSALPDDVLVLILQCLDTTAEAARTSVLARRWRRLWPLLTKLNFELHPDGNRIRELLDVRDAPELRSISVTTKGAAADSATAWLHTAARRLSGGLVYRNIAPDRNNQEEARWGGNVQLPCFEKATMIELDLWFLGLSFPSLGVFTRLTDLSLRCIQGPCELGDLVSSPRCPCLQKLSICYFRGLDNLSIHSESLLQMELKRCVLQQLTIVTPILQKLTVKLKFNFLADVMSEPVVNITAPKLVSLVWKDSYDPRYFHLGNLGQLQELETQCIFVYGEQWHRENNRHCLSLLQQFQALYSLHLSLVYYQIPHGICSYQYLLGDITLLPQIVFLHQDLCSHGHAFGASLFHLLRMCTSLRRLSFVLYAHSYLKEEPDFICDQPENWKAYELVLGHLEDVRIVGLQGAEHEVVVVQRLLGWATILKKLRITFWNKMTDDKIEEFSDAIAGFCRPETHVQIYTRDDN